MSQAQHEILENYYQEIKALYETRATKELSFRTPLENLLKALKPSPSYTIIQEAKGKEAKIQEAKQAKSDEARDKKTISTQNQATEIAKAEFANNAKPDFDVYKKIDKADELSYNSLVGFIECKDIDKDLDTQSEQIKRYLEISPNIILTNYRRFILLSFGKVIYDTTLFDENLNKHLFAQESKDEFFTLISAFFADTSTQIKSKAELVKVLSSQSFYLSISLKNAYDEGSGARSDSTSALFCEFWDKTYDTFKAVQKVDFSELDFCDIISKSIVYGLFVSFVESENIEIDKIDAHSLITLLPSHFKTLHEFIYFSLPNHAIPKRVLYVLDNVKKTLALLDKASMSKFLNLEIEKIAIYLYEDFLKEYDELRSTQKRKQGGVFYTPAPVVEMIVSALDELLISRFGKKQGFLDSEVKVLDFATGTGSFLASVFEKIISKEREAFRNDTIKHKFLRDIYGFEISFVAYIVARLKLGQILKNAGFSDFSDADFCIYLNNTLDLSENANFTMSMPLLSLDDEWKKARDIKHNKNLLVILGNPPYNVKSSNKGEEILKLLDTYKQGLNETNIQPLDDDYIKFIRFAQWKLLEQRKPSSLFDTSNKGLLGFITNNSYLNGRTHRKMRESLAKSFDEIYILNLHGDSREDENVFDIRVGVCISIFVKCNNSKEPLPKSLPQGEGLSIDSPSPNCKIVAEGDKGGGYAKVHYFSTQDNAILRRNDKFALLNDIAHNGLDSIKWQTLALESPYFWFVPKTFDNAEYKNFWALASDKALGESRAIFEISSSGIKTQKDEITIQFTKNQMQTVLQDFTKLDKEEIIKKYKVTDVRDWQIDKAKAEITLCLKSIEQQKISPLPCGGGLGVGIKTDKSSKDFTPPLAPPARGGEQKVSHRPLVPYMKEFSRAMRKNPTQAENKLWQELRGKKLGFGFRRQFVIDSKYIADFVCLEKRLIIECDGGEHNQNFNDIQRDFYLESQNFRILRFWNNEILGNLEGVLSVIKETLESNADFANAKYTCESTHPLAPSAREGEQEKYPHANNNKQESSPHALEQEFDIKKILQSKIMPIAYRPFDTRYTFTSGKTKGFLGYPRFETMKHFSQGENLGICFTKDCEQEEFDNAIISDKPVDIHYNGGQTYIAPLYCFVNFTNEMDKVQKIPNFTREFSAFKAQNKVLKDKSPEQILAFIYANLFSPHYRTKYLEYLKIGFPRIDFEVSVSTFEAFANLGQKLIDLHLMRLPAQEILPSVDFASIDFVGEFSSDMPIDSTQSAKRYENGTITLNKQLSIKGITKEIWQYKIGGYEVLKQWLKYRKNYQASKDELEAFLQTCHAIKASIYLQNELAKIA